MPQHLPCGYLRRLPFSPSESNGAPAYGEERAAGHQLYNVLSHGHASVAAVASVLQPVKEIQDKVRWVLALETA